MKNILFFLFSLVSTLSIYSQPLLNGSFEDGYSNWTYYSQAGDAIVGTGAFFESTEITPSVYPRSGNYMLRLGGYSYNENYVAQNVTLPNANPVKLECYFQSRSFSGTECSGLWVGAKVNVYIGSTSIYETYLCYYNDPYVWTYGFFDLTPLAGQTVSIIFSAEAANSMWSYIYFDDIAVTPSTVGVAETSSLQATNLEQNFPNPFSENTAISYTINGTEKASLELFDETGRKVLTVFDEVRTPGNYTTSVSGLHLDAGTYYYTLKTAETSLTKKMIVVR